MCKRSNFVAALALCTGFGLCTTVMAVAPKNGEFITAAKKNVSQGNGVAGRAFSNGPGGVVTPSPRGGGATIHSGLPACDDLGVCDGQVGVTGTITPECGSTWTSLAFPVATDGAVISSVIMTHNTNATGGHLYLLDDCGGQPDIGEVLYEGCDAIVAGQTGQVVYDLGGAVQTNATTWVVAVFNGSFSFDVAYNSNVPDASGGNTGLGFGNLSGDGAPGEWQDLADFAFGYCYCVEVGICEAASTCCEGAQCDGDANGDGLVDPLDSGYASARFGADVNLPGNCNADVNCDGVIDPLDAGYILARFGSCNPPVLCAPGGGECGSGGSCEPENNAPANDNCANAIVAVEGGNPFDTTFATTDGPEDCDADTGNYDIWYRYTSPSAGTLLLSTCSDISFDGTLSVYSGTSCTGTNLGCSDDGCGQTGGGSEIQLTVTSGQVVTIRVGGWDDLACGNPSRGAGTLTIDHIPTGQGACCFADESCSTGTSSSCTTGGGVFQGAGTACTANLCVAPVSNDLCNGATPQTIGIGDTAVYSGTTDGATADCTGGAEVWEAFTLTETADVVVDYCGTPVQGDFILIVIMDSCGAAGECGNLIFWDGSFGLEDCGDGNFADSLTFSGLAPGTYYVPILGAADGGIDGDYGIRVHARAPERECCEVHALPGCDEILGVPDETVDDCVCAVDPVCCETTWDEACVAEVELFGCGSCTPGCDGQPANDYCECVTPVEIADNEIVQFFGDSTGATLDCAALGIEEVWHAWSHSATDTIRVDYCGTEIPFSFLYIVADNSCPCDATFIFGTQFTANCADATQAAGLRFTNLAAGTYYYPVLSGASGVNGPYGIRIRRDNVN